MCDKQPNVPFLPVQQCISENKRENFKEGFKKNLEKYLHSEIYKDFRMFRIKLIAAALRFGCSILIIIIIIDIHHTN